MDPTTSQIRTWWKHTKEAIPQAVKYKLWSKKQWQASTEMLQHDNEILLDRVELLECFVDWTCQRTGEGLDEFQQAVESGEYTWIR